LWSEGGLLVVVPSVQHESVKLLIQGLF